MGTQPPTTSDSYELDTELTTTFPFVSIMNLLGYDPSLFGGLNYKEIATKLAVLQPPDILRKQNKKKTTVALI